MELEDILVTYELVEVINDTNDPDSPVDSPADSSSDSGEVEDDPVAEEDDPVVEPEARCGCGVGAGAAGLSWVLLLPWLARRRRGAISPAAS